MMPKLYTARQVAKHIGLSKELILKKYKNDLIKVGLCQKVDTTYVFCAGATRFIMDARTKEKKAVKIGRPKK